MKVEVNLRENLIQKIWLEKYDYYVKQTFSFGYICYKNQNGSEFYFKMKEI